MNKKFRLRRGDSVIVTTGRNKNQKGEIVKVLYKQESVIVKGINIVTRHIKPSVKSPEGKLTKEMPIHISNVAYFDMELGKSGKIGYQIVDGRKKRIIKGSGKIINS